MWATPPPHPNPTCILQQQRYLILSKKVHNSSTFRLTYSHGAYVDCQGCPLSNLRLNTRFPRGAIAERCHAPLSCPLGTPVLAAASPLTLSELHRKTLVGRCRAPRCHFEPAWEATGLALTCGGAAPPPACPLLLRELDGERLKLALLHDRDFYFELLSAVFSNGGVPLKAGLGFYPFSFLWHEHAPPDRPMRQHRGAPNWTLLHFTALLPEAKARASCLAYTKILFVWKSLLTEGITRTAIPQSEYHKSCQ